MRKKSSSSRRKRSTNKSKSKTGIRGAVDADFNSRKEKLAQAYLDAARTLEDLRKGLTGDEAVKYYLQEPQLALDTIFGQEKATLDSALAREVDAIREAPDDLAVKLALARGQGVMQVMRVLTVLDFLARGLFRLRDDLIRLNLYEQSKEVVLTDKEKEAVSRLAKYFDDMAKSGEEALLNERRS